MQFLDLAGVKKFKQYIDENFTPIEDHENAEEVTAAALNDLNDRLTDVEGNTGEENIIEAITFNGTPATITNKNAVITETDPIFGASAAAGITSSDINSWNSKGNAKIFYGTCSSSGSDTTKVVTCDAFTSSDLVKGALIFVTFNETNSGAVGSISLNVNNTGAKHITKLYNTTANPNLTSAGELKANKTYLFGYDGTYWVCLTLDYNNSYSSMTSAEITAGVGTSARTITAAVLAENYNITDGTINIAGNSITIKTARIEVNDLSGWTSVTGYSTLYTTIVNSLKASSNNLWRLAITEDQDPYWPTTYYYLSYFGEEDGFIEFIGSDNTTIAFWNNGNIIKSVASSITPGTLITNATTAQTASSGEAMSGNITLHKISKTGSFSDLLGIASVMICDNNVLKAVNGDGITGIMGDTDGRLYALGDNNSNGNEDFVLATTNQIPTVPTISTNVISDKTSDTKTSSPKSVYNEVHPTVVTTQPSGGFVPNIFYRLGTLTGSKTFTLASPSDSTIVNHYYWTFTAGSTAPTITWPSGISWFGGSAPTITAGKHYDVSILDNIAVCMEV